MKGNNIIQAKSYQLAIKIVKVCRQLSEEKREYVLSKQLLRSGTSNGANIEEAIGGQTRKDFTAKILIAYKEARETNYWIKILKDTELINTFEAQNLLNECTEVVKILAKIQKL